MKTITEQRVEWSVLSDPLELDLPIADTDYPVVLQVYDETHHLVLELPMDHPPVLPTGSLPAGRYRCRVLKHTNCLLEQFVIIS